MSERRRPLVIGGRCRHLDGREGLISGVSSGSWGDKSEIERLFVQWDTGGAEWLLPGYLESIPSELSSAP
jgi:hypothetical protein